MTTLSNELACSPVARISPRTLGRGRIEAQGWLPLSHGLMAVAALKLEKKWVGTRRSCRRPEHISYLIDQVVRLGIGTVRMILSLLTKFAA
jgi:hypothetical protein